MNDSKRKPLPAELQDEALVDIKTAGAMLGLASTSPIYDRLRRQEPGFPPAIRLSKRCTRFRVRDIRAYIAMQQGGA